MFKAMWNNFYNWAVRDASAVVKGAIIFACFVLGMMCLAYSLKKGKDGKPIGNWFLFWLAILFTLLGIGYVILLSV